MSVDTRPIVAASLAVLVAAGLVVRGGYRYGPSPVHEVMVAGVARAEGCLRCHHDVRGLGPAHDPAALGCSTCHLGDPVALDEASAHRGMVLLSGDLSTAGATCGQAACHPAELARVDKSVMAGAPGLLAINRFVFGERSEPRGGPEDDLRRLDSRREPSSPAESHVRKLCASCHLGMPKGEVGDQGFFSRGGGCTACHLGPAAATAAQGRMHPDVTAQVREARCEGCHARSGRISLSYHGKVEVEPGDPRRSGQLPDGRPVAAAPPDVHAKAGMTCMDCHTERCLMGDGEAHVHSYEAVDVGCEDCHAGGAEGAAVPADKARVADTLRQAWGKRGRGGLSLRPLRTKSGTPLWRTDADTRTMVLQESGEPKRIPVAAEEAYHRLRGHERLSCQACHTVWAPRCTKCHTVFQPEGKQVDHLSGRETRGEWVEEAGGNGEGAPLLAVGPEGRIGPFVEGMTLRIDGLDRPVDGEFWAPLDAHTTGKSRVCGSCHGESARGVYPQRGRTTRTGARLLDEAERGRVEQVGRCVGCHERYDDVVYADFGASLERLRKRDAGDRAVARCGGR